MEQQSTNGSKSPLMPMNRNIRPKCGLARWEMKPLLQFHVIDTIFPNHQLSQCQRPVLAQRLQQISVISLCGFWEAFTVRELLWKERKGLEGSGGKAWTFLSWSVLVGGTGVHWLLPHEVDLFHWETSFSFHQHIAHPLRLTFLHLSKHTHT